MQPQQLWHGRMQQRDNILAFGTKKCETVQPVEQCVFHNQETLCQCNRVLVSHVTMSLLEGHSRFAAALQKHLGILQSSELSSHPYGCGDHSALVWSNATGTNGCQTLPLRGLLENIASNRLFLGGYITQWRRRITASSPLFQNIPIVETTLFDSQIGFVHY